MNELLTRVTQQTGLSAEQAQAAVNSVIGFLKEKLPGLSPTIWIASPVKAKRVEKK